MKNKFFRFLCIIVLFLFIIPSLTLGLESLLTVVISEIYDDNVTSSWINKKDDYISNLNIGLGLSHTGKISTFNLMGHVNQKFYFINHDFSYNSQDLILNYRIDFTTNSYLTLREIFYHSFEPNTFDAAFDRPVNWYQHYQNNISLLYSLAFTSKFIINTRYQNGITYTPEKNRIDSYSNTIGLQSDFFISSFTFFSLFYNFDHVKIDANDEIILDKNSASTNSLGAGARQYFSKTTYLDCKGGIDFIKSFNNKNYKKPLYTISIINDVNENSNFSLIFSKSNRVNPNYQDISDDWRISLSYISQLLSRLRVSISAFRGEGEYISMNIKNKLIGASGSLIFEITDKIDCELGYTYTYSDTSIRPHYTRNSALIGLRGEF